MQMLKNQMQRRMVWDCLKLWGAAGVFLRGSGYWLRWKNLGFVIAVGNFSICIGEFLLIMITQRNVLMKNRKDDFV